MAQCLRRQGPPRLRRRLRALAGRGGMSEHEHDHTLITNGTEPAAAMRARSLETLLVEKGVLRAEEIRAGIDWLVSRTPADGARVARAWVDTEFKRRLLDVVPE